MARLARTGIEGIDGQVAGGEGEDRLSDALLIP